MGRRKGSKNKKFKDIKGQVPTSPFRACDVAANTPAVKINLKSLGRVFASEGATFEEAINKIKISGGARAISVINVKIGDKEITKILNARQTNGLFSQGSPTMRDIHLRGVKQILGV